MRLMGPVSITRDQAPAPLPRSRKVLALLSYLVLEGGEQSRSRLCDLLWNGPNDPRGELRWCLSKLRALVDDGERRRVLARGSALVGLDMSDAFVDVIEVERALAAGIPAVASQRLGEVLDWFRGDVLEGLEVEGSAELTTWLAARRQRFRARRARRSGTLSRRRGAPRDSDPCLRAGGRRLVTAPRLLAGGAHESADGAGTFPGRDVRGANAR